MKQTPLGVKPRFLTLGVCISAVSKTKYKSCRVAGGSALLFLLSLLKVSLPETFIAWVLNTELLHKRSSDMLFKKLLLQIYGPSPTD